MSFFVSRINTLFNSSDVGGRLTKIFSQSFWNHENIGGHTNTERGYLPILAKKLTSELQSEANDVFGIDPALASTLRSLEVHVSKEDKHPLQIV